MLWQVPSTELYHQQEKGQEAEEGDSSPLLGIGEIQLEFQVPCWAAPVRETHGHSGAGPGRDHENDEGTVASYIRRGCKSQNFVAWRREDSGKSYSVSKHPTSECIETRLSVEGFYERLQATDMSRIKEKRKSVQQ